MFKNVKKLFLLVVLTLVGVLAFACGEECPTCNEANKETCDQFCEKCPEEQKCPEIDEEACKDYINTCPSIDKESCKDFCDTCPVIDEEACKDYINTCPPINEETCDPFIPEINKETCKDFIEECEKCPTCNEANVENCKGFCEECKDINEETCQEFFPYVAPEAFILLEDFVTVGQTVALIAEEFEPIADNVYTGLFWSSSDESIATVDGEGVVTGIKPGKVIITATSVLDSEVSESCEVIVNDSLEAYDLLQREKALISANVPAYTADSFEFPKPWNETVEMIVTDENNNEVTGFTYPAGLAKETKYTYNVTLTYGSNAPETFTVSFWAVLDAEDNSYVRLAKGLEAIEIIIKDAANGKLVEEDMLLPTYVYGATFTWDSALPSIIDDEGVYTQQNDNTPVSFDLVGKCGDNSTSKSYTFTAKGYSKEEKLAYILEEGSLANVAGKTVSTSIVLPAYDGKFNAGLSYVSSKPEIMDNTGKLVAAPEVATDVEFTVTVNYEFVKKEKFTADTKFTVTVAPANVASKAADAWLQESGFAQLVNFPYGTEKGNVLDVPTEYTKDEVKYTVKWDVSKAVVAPKYLDGEEVETCNAFELTEEGKPELVVQYLRYQEVQIQGTFSDGTNEAVVTLVLNIGASEGAQYVYSGTWTTGDQKDSSLNPVTGEYDTMGNASHFDKNVGYVSRSLGYGYWSGVKITAPEYEGAVYESFILDYMYWEVVDDGNGGVAKRDLALFNNGGDMGGNWGWFMHNTTDKDIMIEVGTYAATGQAFSDGTDVLSAGSRVSYAMDGYAVGFVADKDGKILNGSGNGKLQNSVPSTNLVKIGSDEAKYFVGDSKTGTVYYLTVPAGGYAMSWKYQFYSQKVQSLYPLCQTGAQLEITKYGVHPLNSTKATSALTNLENAEAKIAAGGIAGNSAIESYLIAARNSYNNDLSEVTKAAVFSAERIEAAEAAAGLLIDAEIADLLANEKDAEGNIAEGFTTKLGNLYNRFAKYTPELLAKVTKKADFDAKYAEYAAIDLYINYDYNGGYAQGFIYDTQKSLLMPMFLKDLYDHMVEKGAFQKKIEAVDGTDTLVDDPTAETPSFETFCTAEYWNQYAQYKVTVLNYYLFTAYTEDNENYRNEIEGSDRFFNTAKGQYWIALADWVNEATQYANGAGQDFWGRNGLPYVDTTMLKNQTYYNSSMYKDLTSVLSTNSGTLLGCYRFAQYVMDSSLNGNYKTYVPNMVWSTIFDRQTTQEQYGQQVYHCTDATVTLFDAPYKAGAEFAGWVFEDGSPAVVTGAMFKDVTVYAKWNPVLETKIEAVVGEDLTPAYYPEANPVKAATEPGTLNTQVASYGLGKYAIAAGGYLVIMPKYATIELDGTKDYSVKENLQVYGTDGTAQNSSGLVYDAKTDTVRANNSYGHGALYQNVSDGEITIPNVALCYGRELAGAGYGYEKIQFVLQEDGTYVAKTVGANGEAKLAKGDFLWAPMTDARWCVPLSNGGQATIPGVLTDGAVVKVVEITDDMLPVEKAWYTVKFVDGETTLDAQYLEEGEAIVKHADLKAEGYTFKGWSETPEGTEPVEIPEIVEKDVTYYAIWETLSSVDATFVDPANVGATPYTFGTIIDALNATNPGGTITVAAGTYTDALTLEKAVTIVGPNAGKSGQAADRAEEAVIDAPIAIKVEGVVIDGVKLGAASNIEFAAGQAKVTNVYSLAATFLKTSDANRTAVLYATAEVSDVEISNSYFNIGGGSYLKGVWTSFNTVSNISFLNNYFTHENTDNSSISDCIAMYNVAGKLDFIGNHFVWVTDDWDMMIGVNSNNCTEMNVIENTFDGVGELYTCGIYLRRLQAGNVCNIIGNTFNTLAGTIISGTNSAEGSIYNIKYNSFNNCKYKESAWPTGVVANFENNFYALEQTSVTPDAGQVASKEALDELYKDYSVTIQDFADEIVALFNSTGMSDAKVTTQGNFTGTTHPNVKYVFGNAEVLTKYKWFLEYILAETIEVCEANGLADDSMLTQYDSVGKYKEMLQGLVDGKTDVIGGDYIDGRTCLRQFIHRLINAENAEAGAGNSYYNTWTVDYANNPEKVAEFLELYKANN